MNCEYLRFKNANNEKLNCKAGSYKSTCGIEHCYKVTGESCRENAADLRGGKCHSSGSCVDGVCRYIVQYHDKIFSEANSGSYPNKIPNQLFIRKRNLHPRLPLAFFDFISEDSIDELSIEDHQ